MRVVLLEIKAIEIVNLKVTRLLRKEVMYMMIKMSYLFGFVNDLEKIICGLGFKLILKK